MSGQNLGKNRDDRLVLVIRHEPDIVAAIILMAAATVLFALGHSLPGLATLAAGFVAVVYHLMRLPASVGNEVRLVAGQKIDEKYSLLQNCSNVGLSMVYNDRKQAVQNFWTKHVTKNLKRGDKVYIIGVSLRGWDTTGTEILDEIIKLKGKVKNKVEFRILLTHPQYSRIRDPQDTQPKGTIAGHILGTLGYLNDHGIPKEWIKLYKGMPTAFIIATPKSILFQPYPQQAPDCNVTMFTLMAEKGTGGIYEQMWDKNVRRPWEDKELSEDYDPNKHEEYKKKAEQELHI